MTAIDIRPLREATPFETFALHVTGKWSHDVDRPERVSFSPHGGALYLHGPDGQVKAIVSMDRIVSISVPARPCIRGTT